MMSSPAVAVVVPVRNRPTLLQETLASVRAQTFGDWECIIVDDGSTDETRAAAAAWAASDDRFRVVDRVAEPHGANACRNLGVRESHAGFLVFLDSDDLLDPECLGRRVDVMRTNSSLAFAAFDAGVFHDRPGDLGRPFDAGAHADDLDRFLSLDPPWHTTSPIWRREALRRLGGWDDQRSSWQDVDMHIRALASRTPYLRQRLVDHHVRWKDSPDRISRRKAFDTNMFANCEPCMRTWRAALIAGGTWSPGRDDAIAGVAFHLAEQWALQRHMRRAWLVWGAARDLGIPFRRLLAGNILLAAMSTPAGSTTPFRGLLRRWKIGAHLMPRPVAQNPQ